MMNRAVRAVKFDNPAHVPYVPADSNKEVIMYVWSQRLVIGLLAAFTILVAIFFLQAPTEQTSALKIHTTRWIVLNYAGLVIWIFVWMFDQARVRGKNLAVWFVPFIFAPLPTLMLFILAMQRRLKG
jgi:ABC-type Fe3+-siderophore transport system permease subunit